MEYKNSSLYIKSDFEIKSVKEWEYDVDLLISLEDRCLNIYLDDIPQYIMSRIQLPNVRGILIRYCKLQENNICTIHFLKDIGMHSTILNFEVDYSKHFVNISDKEYFVEMKIDSKANILTD
jgi:hypothetical protein